MLVLDLGGGRYRVPGWIWNEAGKVPEYWAPRMPWPCYRVPQADLYDPSTSTDREGLTVPILDLQKRYRELGRLRLGDTLEGDEGKRARPVRLSTWRLTSPSRDLLEQAADTYGGQVQVWEGAPTEGEQFELVTDRAELDVLVPPQDLAGRQYLELYTRGGVKRRCDGVTELLTGRPCMCDPEKRECSPVTHLVVMLPELADVGVWRCVTRSWYAAAELPGTTELLARLAAKGAIPRAVLKIDARTVVRDGQTRHFVLPALAVTWSIAQAEAEGVPILHEGRPAISDGATALPADAAFEHDRAADWGAAPELEPPQAPAAEPLTPAANEPAGNVRVTAGEAGKAEGYGEGPEVEPAHEGEGAVAVREGTAAAPELTLSDTPWSRYNTAALEHGKPELQPALLRRAIRAAGLEYPPGPDWPGEVLTSCAAILEGAAAAARS